MREFTPLAILLGIVIGALLAAANTFIGLKVGLPIVASLPAAVISLTILRGLLKRGTVLENNMVQTIGSAGQSVATGLIFTVPVLFIMGLNPHLLEMVVWGGLGGLMGVLLMIPLRRLLIAKQQTKLSYPEGVACAELIEAGEHGGSARRTVLWGLTLGAMYQCLRELGFWKSIVKFDLPQIHSRVAMDTSAALVGLGYILGPRVAGVMLGGAVMGWFVVIPLFSVLPEPALLSLTSTAGAAASTLAPAQVHDQYVKYIGVGALVLGGLLALIKSVPAVLSPLVQAARTVFDKKLRNQDRTDRDLPLLLIVLMLVAVGYAVYRVPQVGVGQWGVVAVLVGGLFFTAVSARLAGVVGSSSQAVSGLAVAAVLGTAFLLVETAEHAGSNINYTVVVVCAIICAAIGVAGDCAQDLKTGFLLKATPWKQQLGEIIGVLTSTVVVAGVILLLNDSHGFVVSESTPNPMAAPHAHMLHTLIEGVSGSTIPWTFVTIGMAAALMLELLALPALPFAIGLYLPLHFSIPIMLGGIIRWAITRSRKTESPGKDSGILGASGLVAGEAIAGVAFAGITALLHWRWLSERFGSLLQYDPLSVGPWFHRKIAMISGHELTELGFELLPLVPFTLLMLWLTVAAARGGPREGSDDIAMPVPLSEKDVATLDDEDTTLFFEEVETDAHLD